MNGLIKCHGGKHYLKDWIISNFPSNYETMTFVDTFVGGGNIVLNKEHSSREIINDKNTKLINLYNTVVLYPKELINQLKTINYSEETFENALNDKDSVFDDAIDEAINTYILFRMSRGGMQKTYASSNRLRGGIMGDQNAWETSINNIENISKRLQNIEILNKDYRFMFHFFNKENIFFYLDPPYLLSTRISKDVYDYEMTERDHVNLLDLCIQSKAKILLSGYESKIYNIKLTNWTRQEKIIINHSSQQLNKQFRTEILWSNY
jgi:DNA adenine methylase